MSWNGLLSSKTMESKRFYICNQTRKINIVGDGCFVCPFCRASLEDMEKHVVLKTKELLSVQPEHIKALEDLAAVTLDQLANDPGTPEIRNFAPVFLRYTESRVFPAYLVVIPSVQDPEKTVCRIRWWWYDVDAEGITTLKAWDFESPNQWKSTVEGLVGECSPFQGHWDQTWLKHKGGFITLQSLKKRFFQMTRQSQASKKRSRQHCGEVAEKHLRI